MDKPNDGKTVHKVVLWMHNRRATLLDDATPEGKMSELTKHCNCGTVAFPCEALKEWVLHVVDGGDVFLPESSSAACS